MKLGNLCQLLKENPYPGRGIVMGRTADGKKAVAAYFIMGRSENSRNRVFENTEDGIRTKAFDESKMTDPSLIIYHPVRLLENGLLVVTNGDQTDTIQENITQGHCYRHALNTRAFEPDGPNFTPRISGVMKPDGSYNLSILKSLDGDPRCCCRYFFEYDSPIPGTGHFIHTYQGDGDPLPSFQGEPRLVDIHSLGARETAAELAGQLWDSLNEENKVSLYVRTTDIESGFSESVIYNKHR
ncbi:MAG: inosine monophosphate cyclohydrolase [Lawsonibacter sp.]|nr:inosine monophosphate cyclohydrolase [Lawsonibacter sp.]